MAFAPRGTQLERGTGPLPGSNYTTIALVKNIEHSESEADLDEITSLDSEAADEEYLPVLSDAGEIEIDVVFAPGQDSQALVQDDFENGRLSPWRVVLPNGLGTWGPFLAYVASDDFSAPIDRIGTRTIKLQITGFPRSPYIRQQAYNYQLEQLFSCAVTMPDGCAAGNYLIAEYTCRADGTPPTLDGDTAGNDWIQIVGDVGYGLWYCLAKDCPAGNVITWGNHSYDQTGRVMEVARISSPPSIAFATGTIEPVASVTAGGVTVSMPFTSGGALSTWAAAILTFAAVEGAPSLLLSTFLCGALNGIFGTGGFFNIEGDTFGTPAKWKDLFPNNQEEQELYTFKYSPVFPFA